MAKTVVIDTCVAQACGGRNKTDKSLPVVCKCLLAVTDFGHSAYFDDELLEEWKMHKGTFASRWLRDAWSRKRVVRGSPVGKPKLLSNLKSALSTHASMSEQRKKKSIEAIEKDFFLITCAHAADKIILSLDREFSDAIGQSGYTHRDLQVIQYVHPALHHWPTVQTWLNGDCPFVTAWALVP